jgi:hypothetical protein
MGKKKTVKKTEKKNTKKDLIKDFFYLEQDTKKLTYFEIVTTAFLYVFLSSFALIVSDKIYENITATKLYALISMFGIWFILMCVGLLEKIRSKKVNAEYFKQAVKNLSVTDIALIAYTLVAFISAILSEYREVAFIGDKARNEGFLIQLMYISMFFMLSRTYVHKLELKIWALASMPVALIGILQLNGYYAGKFTYDIEQIPGLNLFSVGKDINIIAEQALVPVIHACGKTTDPIGITGSENIEAVDIIAKYLKDNTDYDWRLLNNFFDSVDIAKSFLDCSGIILVEKYRSSQVKKVNRILEVCKNNNITVYGVIIVE